MYEVESFGIQKNRLYIVNNNLINRLEGFYGKVTEDVQGATAAVQNDAAMVVEWGHYKRTDY